MERVNNLIVVLTVVLLLISLLGTFTLAGKINFAGPSEGPSNTVQGKVGLNIISQETSSLTGHVGLKIIPEEMTEE